MEREITYTELHQLQERFCKIIETQSIIFPNDEQEEMCLDDFIEQYVQGSDNPIVRIDW